MIYINHLYKIFNEKRPEEKYALIDISLKIDDNEFIYLVGPSGSGKTTILKMLNREELPTRGEVIVDNENLSEMRKNRIPFYRRKLGIIFQDFKLLPTKTVLENIVIIMRAQGNDRRKSINRAREILKLIGIGSKQNFLPDELSRGEQRLLTIARALANSPKFILADEPLVDLNKPDQKKIIEIFEKYHREGTTVVVATKQIEYTELLPARRIKIISGKIKE